MSSVQALMRRVLSGAARLARLGEATVRPRSRQDPRRAESILVLEYLLPLGNLVHMTPVFAALKAGSAERTVTVATRGPGSGVLRHSPFVDHLLETPDPLTDLRAATRSLRRQLQQRGLVPDCCLTGVADQRTRIALLAALACSGWRGGYTLLPAFYGHALSKDPSRSLIANNLRLASLVGADGYPREPSIFFTEADARHAQELVGPLRQRGRGVLALVSQNSGGQRTGWHDERWVEVLRFVHEQLGYEPAFVGTEQESRRIAALQRQCGGLGVSFAGKTTISQLAAVLAASDLVVALDTGTMHVARAVGVPMVVLGPSWQKPTEWLPLGKPHVIILRGEDRDDVPEGYKLDEISAGNTIEALRRLSAAYPPSEADRQTRRDASLSAVDLLGR